MSGETKTILVGTTLARNTDGVVRTAAEMARALGARLHLAHGYFLPSWYGEGPLEPQPDQRAESDDFRQALRDEMTAQLRRVGLGPEAAAELHLEPGPVHRLLSSLAARLEAELVVVGAGDGDRIHRFGLGSTTRRLLGGADRPVLVVRQPPFLPPTRVLAAVDLSPLSADALRGGIALAGRLWQGHQPPRLEVVFVLHPRERELSRQFTAEQIDRFAAEELDRFLRRNTPALAPLAHQRVLVGGAREKLAAEMDSLHPDLVILGTHGRSGFERFLVGSVATDVAARAPRCALIVPPEAARRAAREAEEALRRGGDWSYVSDHREPLVPTR